MTARPRLSLCLRPGPAVNPLPQTTKFARRGVGFLGGAATAQPRRSCSQEPVPAERKGTAMNHPHTYRQQSQHLEELASCTIHERLRFLWYRLRLTIADMNPRPAGWSSCRYAGRAAAHAVLGNLSTFDAVTSPSSGWKYSAFCAPASAGGP